MSFEAKNNTKMRSIKMINKNVFFPILLISVLSISCSVDRVTVLSEKIVVSEYDLENSNLELKQFNFFWKQLVQTTPLETHFTDTIIGRAGLWVNYKDKSGEKISTTGYGTFHIKLTNIEDDVLYLHHGLISSAWKIWCNNELIHAEGVVAESKQETVERMKSGVVALPIKDGVANIYIEVSSYSFYSGGIIRPLYIGTRDNIVRFYKIRGLIDFGLITFVLAIALYNLGGSFFSTKKDKSHLYFALFCIIALIRQMCLGTIPLTIWFPDFSPTLFHIIKHLGFMVSTFFAIQYFFILFKELMSNLVIQFLGIGTLLLSVLFPFFSVVYGLQISIAFLILLTGSVLYLSFIIIRSINSNNLEALIPLAGLLFFIGFVLHDVLVASNVIHSVYKQQYGFFVFAISQIVYLSIRHIKTATQLEFAQSDLRTVSAFTKVQADKKDLLLKKLQTINQDKESPNAEVLINELRQYIISNEVIPEQKIALENIDKLNTEFFSHLSYRYPNLTKAETELCGYLRAGMNSKEIANIRNIAPESVKRARIRLRKKLNLTKGADLNKFLIEIK